ncbi:hypothetical protein CRE_06885 [Caenorhabditis remanei]|uniref:BTB domain-containing protein n=1 Tax=Caenorhabditis remanei TaxID=31234 RepID=E3MZQ0_CAERE|nr:hypothetical protein CRE_06885 [Caenorhabditis remanei]
MWGAAIDYKSGTYHINGNTNVLETKSHEGIECVWSGRNPNISVFSSLKIKFTWKFDWSKLKNQGVDELTGHIYVYSRNSWFPATKIDVKLTGNRQEIIKQIQCRNYYDDVSYEYSLTPHYAPTPRKLDYDKMFQPSELNDTILVVEGKKLHVNKTFLSYHSEYFRALFSSNFKEGQMDEIPIGDVSYEDFALLLSTFYPKPSYPNDSTVEKLLEMGRRFLVSSAISSAEHHLITNSTIENEEMLWLADEYGMPTLLEKCIRKITTVEDAKQLKKSEKYGQLSDKTKVKLYERLVDSM